MSAACVDHDLVLVSSEKVASLGDPPPSIVKVYHCRTCGDPVTKEYELDGKTER